MREHFLLPRLLLNHLALLIRLAERRPIVPDSNDTNIARDIVCGMAIDAPTISYATEGKTFAFCSEECRSRFQLNPARYLSSGA